VAAPLAVCAARSRKYLDFSDNAELLWPPAA
jgi:hypothetical protein